MIIVPFFVVIPLATAFIIPMTARLEERFQDALAIISSLAIFALSAFACVALGNSASGVMAYKLGSLMPPAGIALIIDGLSVFMLVTVNLVAFFIALYASGYMKKYTDKWKFYSLFFLMLSGINGVLLASDIFNLYVFMEIAAIAAYFLVAFGTEAEELEAAFKYAIMGSVASCFILLGIAFLYGHTSTLNMADMASALAMSSPSRVVQFVSVLFIMGFGLKAALAPFHAWLAYAHSSAPAPVSAMLSGVLIKVLGIYALCRIFFNVFGMTVVVSQLLMVLAVLSMIVGAILAFGQSDIKKLFAYSTVSQIGYVALGLGIGTPLAIFGALFHLFNHSIFKSLLFMDAGSIETLKGTRDLNKISGVLADAPITGYSTLVSALSICGVPPLGGFWSKAIIIFACIQAHRPVLAFIAALVSILTLAYYFRALTPALFAPASEVRSRPTPAMNVAMAAMAVLVIASAIALLPSARQALFNGAVNVVTDGIAYAAAITGAIR
jgi:multicomponent Na+:H+ antiporter subunit D